VSGEAMYIANTPMFTTADVLSLRLEEAYGGHSVEIVLSPEAAKRLRAGTGDNIGETLVTKINGETTGVKIPFAIPGPKMIFAVKKLELKDACRGR
jgi:hypothetical protein